MGAAGRAAHSEHNLKPEQSTAAWKSGNNAPTMSAVSWPLSQLFVLAPTIIRYWYRFRSRVSCSVWIIHSLFGQILTKSSTTPPTMCRSLKQKCTTSSYSMWYQVCRNVSSMLRRTFLKIWFFYCMPNNQTCRTSIPIPRDFRPQGVRLRWLRDGLQLEAMQYSITRVTVHSACIPVLIQVTCSMCSNYRRQCLQIW